MSDFDNFDTLKIQTLDIKRKNLFTKKIKLLTKNIKLFIYLI